MKTYVAIPAILALVARAVSKKSLTPGGIAAAVATATAHAYHPWNLPFALLVIFFLAGTRATHVKERVKASMTLKSTGSSGGEGPRNHIQVLANSLVASILTVLHARQLYARSDRYLEQGNSYTGIPDPRNSLCYSWGGDVLVVGIIANYAAVAADTFSSELGILSKSEPRLITSLGFRKVPRGTNGGVSLMGLAAGLFGSILIVASAMIFLPSCTEETAQVMGGGQAWTMEQRRIFMAFLVFCGFCGTLLDSILGGLFQRSVKDVRSGKIVEGDGGRRALVSSDAPSNAASAKEKGSTGVKTQTASRVVESGWDLLDNNDVNFLTAVTVSVGAMAAASWYWGIPMQDIWVS